MMKCIQRSQGIILAAVFQVRSAVFTLPPIALGYFSIGSGSMVNKESHQIQSLLLFKLALPGTTGQLLDQSAVQHFMRYGALIFYGTHEILLAQEVKLKIQHHLLYI